MDWNRSKKRTKPRRPQPKTTHPPGSLSFTRTTRTRSNSFVLSRVFDESIEKESQNKDNHTHFGCDDEDDFIRLQDVEYDFGSEW